MPAFPSHITFAVLADGYSEQRQTNILAFKPDVGRPKLRRRTSMVDVIMTIQGWMSSDDFDDFDDFYGSDLADGTLPFTWTHPRTGEAATFQFEGEPPKLIRAEGANYLIQWTARIISMIELYRLADFDFATLVDGDGAELVTR